MSTPDAAPNGRAPIGGPDLPAALPSPVARALAFVAIAAAGVCGGLIGYAVVDLQVDGDGGAAAALGGVVGAVLAAAGVAVVAVLTLRAMTEWSSIEERRRRQAPDGRP
ncbi:hypothetical protein [Actinomarinicola tropica]|uniref:Uncharacterized protein n=1 Tax=Actinomarinicola tropica TaxID=2789776 RepID=A0A5Q2RQU6_9ACTN|nr:hypothetical protein [Actinomarinicola tropica]QGG95565.1 hypothetical protein GH723_10925 [Actinomarinicola tropica]